MIIDNSPLGFSKSRSGCDCRADNFSLPIALTDSQQWQVDIACQELTGGTEKLPCEENQIGPYTQDMQRYLGDTEQGLLSTYLISATDIRFEDFQSGGNLFSTEPGFLQPNRCYWLRYTISSYIEGWIQTIVGSAPEGERTTGPNPARRANGTYTEVYCTDAEGRLRFQVGPDDDPEDVATFILSNIFIGCIRYSELYAFTGEEEDLELTTFSSQTTICKETTTSPVHIALREQPFIVGQTYRICFTISGSTAGLVELLFGPTTPIEYVGNGNYCVEIEYVDETYSTMLAFSMTEAFDGCLGDITVYLVPDYQIALYDNEGYEVEGMLNIQQIGSTLKIELSPSVLPGCYQIGIADNCSNYRNQFYGNILLNEAYSELLDLPSTGKYMPFTIVDGVYSLDFVGWDDLPNGTYTFVHYFVMRDAVCYQKLYDFLFNFSLTENGNDISTIGIFVYLAGDLVGTDTQPSPGASVAFSFEDLIAGPESGDNCESYSTDNASFCALVGKNALLVEIVTEITKANNTDPVISFNANNFDSYAVMDQDPMQFCPEYFSIPLNVSTEPACDTILIKYRNPQDAFDFDYTSEGYREEDGFYNQIRIEGRLWKPNHPKTKLLQKASTGRRTNYYSDVDKKMTLTTGLLPEHLHDALALALEHETLIIEDVELVCESEEYAPTWDKSSELASVEVELFVQQRRKLNTKC